MFCQNCGKEIADDAVFCPECGAVTGYAGTAQDQPASEHDTAQDQHAPDTAPERPTPNIELCADGVYRWFYTFDMLKNPVILFTVWNVLAISFGITLLFSTVMSVISDGGNVVENLLGMGKGFAILFGVFVVIGFIAYLIVAKSYGWRYQVLFEMDETGIVHKQMPSQFDRAQALSWLTLMAARTATTAGAAMLAASKSESVIRFESTRKVKVVRRLNTIKVNEFLEHSQVYAEPEDYDFVLDYIKRHLPDTAKVSGR